MKKILASIVVAAAALVAEASEKTIQATGMGATYRSAVNEALVSALEQEAGVTLSASEKTVIYSSDEHLSVNGNVADRLQIDDSIKKDMQKWASGKINGYEVVSEDYDESSKKYRVVLSVRMPDAYKVGLDPENRRRMAIARFRVLTGDTISWFGLGESSARWASALADKLNEHMTQTRKFTMVDRKFDAEIDSELARISAANASKRDVSRLNQKLATDYLVVGTVSLSPVAAPERNPFTGHMLPQRVQRFAEVSYRVLLAPTGQLKWADTVVVDTLECPAADMVSFIGISANAAAKKIADAVMANILPLEVVGVSKSGTVVIGEGGKSLAKGERFTVCKLGEMMEDSRTGEQLEELREIVATVEITRVTPKMSYARIVEGDAKSVTKGCVLERIEMPRQIPQPPPPNTTVVPAGNGGVVTPF